MTNENENQSNTNGKVPAAVPEGAIVATTADFIELIKANPSLELPLTNIVQKRLLAEKDAEIAELKEAQAG